MIAIDTNLLVYAHRAQTSEHRGARKALERAAKSKEGWGVAYPCLWEFWSIVTHPKIGSRPSNPSEAASFVFSLTETGGMTVWLPQAGFWARLLQAALDLNAQGARIFDLHIAMIASDNGAVELWTHDKGFLSLPGLRVYDPLEK